MIFKDKQRDSYTLLDWIRGNIFGQRCQSHITPPLSRPKITHRCDLIRGHRQRHRDNAGFRWGYGDDTFGVEQ